MWSAGGSCSSLRVTGSRSTGPSKRQIIGVSGKTSLRELKAAGSLSPVLMALVNFKPGGPVPVQLNRHATAHAAGPEQYSDVNAVIALMLMALLCLTAPATAQVSVSIGINVPVYPRLVRVPGYPVYYAPGLDANFFFYDGAYWVFHDDNWYVGTWYNGPWRLVDRYAVPVYILRIPVRYYRRPPAYFHGWPRDPAPRWAEHCGSEWREPSKRRRAICVAVGDARP